jgi:hypothetical protein
VREPNKAAPTWQHPRDQRGDHLSLLTDLGTLGEAGHDQNQRVVEEISDEDHIEEFFGKLWSIPHSPDKARVSNQASYGGHLVWIWRDLVKSQHQAGGVLSSGEAREDRGQAKDVKLLMRHLGRGIAGNFYESAQEILHG